MLAAKKVGNEVFDMSNEVGTFNQALWDKTVRVIREINETSGLALPESVEVIEERKERQKKEGAEKRTELVQKRKVEREAEREAEAADREKRKKDEKAAQEQAREKQLQQAKQARQQQAEALVSKHFGAFLLERCRKSEALRIHKTALQAAFDDYCGEKMRPCLVEEAMKKHGYPLRQVTIHSVKNRGYTGIDILHL